MNNYMTRKLRKAIFEQKLVLQLIEAEINFVQSCVYFGEFSFGNWEVNCRKFAFHLHSDILFLFIFYAEVRLGIPGGILYLRKEFEFLRIFTFEYLNVDCILSNKTYSLTVVI